MERPPGADRKTPRPLSEPTPRAVADALAELLPGVDSTVVDWGQWDTDGDPRYHRRGILLAGGELFAKFAWSEEAADPIAREGRILEILGRTSFPAPEIVAVHPDVALFVTRRVPGGPVTSAGLGQLSFRRLNRFAGQLVDALVELRSSQLRDDLVALADPKPPRAQADPDELRADLEPMIRPDQWRRVLALLERVELVLATPGPDSVVLHGDLHGYNLVWDGEHLAAVCDFESLAVGDPSFEVRYLPDNAPTQAYVRAVLEGLRRAGHDDEVERALAWHVLTRLGDARWRTLAGVELPGGGTPAQWVDELFAALAEHATLI